MTDINISVSTRLGSRLALLAAFLFGFPLTASAQQYFDPGLFQKSVLAMPADYAPVGGRVGSFTFNTGAELGYYHNDNVFYLEEGEIDDTSINFRPYINLNSDWNRHALNVTGWADIARYNDFSLNDYEDWGVRADGRVDVKQNSWFSADTHYMRLHEDRRTPDSRFGLRPTVFDYSGYGAGYDHNFNRLSVGIYYNFNQFDYDNNVTDTGELIDNQFRNREQNRYTVKASYQLGADTSVFVDYGWNEVEYDILDEQGISRNSDGYAFGGGVRWNISELLTGSLAGRWNKQSYDDSSLSSVDGFGVSANLTWTPRPTTTVSLRFAGSPQETIQPGTSGYFSQLYSVRWQEELRRNLLFNLRGSWTPNDFENPGLDPANELSSTDVYRADIGISYLFNRNLYITGGYSWEQQDANVSIFEYTANRYFLTLGVQL